MWPGRNIYVATMCESQKTNGTQHELSDLSVMVYVNFRYVKQRGQVILQIRAGYHVWPRMKTDVATMCESQKTNGAQHELSDLSVAVYVNFQNLKRRG